MQQLYNDIHSEIKSQSLMTRKTLFFILTFVIMSSAVTLAQDTEKNMEKTMDEESMMKEEEINPFPPKPKNMWEIGLQGGASVLTGDVSPKYPVPFSGFAVGLHVRKALNYTFSLRLAGNYGQTVGINKKLSGFTTTQKDLDIASLGYSKGDAFLRNYKMKYWEVSFQGIMNMGNIFFHGRENKWNFYAFMGIGLMGFNTSIDALDGESPYSFTGFTDGGTVDERAANQDRYLELSDGEFETPVQSIQRGSSSSKGFVIYNNNNDDIIIDGQVGVGLSRKITDRFNIGLEYKTVITGNDFLDGFTYRTTGDKTIGPDYLHHVTLHLNFNIGSDEKRVEPLYWVNPLVGPMEDLAEVKARPVLDLTDSDNDGVIDEWDKAPNTKDGVAVDVKGRPLDTDGDGIADFEDQEKFSPSGVDVNEDGVAIVNDPYLTESQIKDLIDERIESSKVSWFLPMIHFDLDKYYIKPGFVPELAHVAQVIKNNPNINVVVKGYADNRASEQYNAVLSFNRAQAAIDYLVENFNISRNSLILQYGGEDSPLIPNVPANYSLNNRQEYKQYMNRRVEFSVAEPGDSNMNRPEGPDAGSGRPSGNYSGSRGSGY